MAGLSRNTFSGPIVRVRVRLSSDLGYDSWSQKTRVRELPDCEM